MKKYGLWLVLAGLLSLVACGPKPDVPPAPGPAPTASAAAPAASQPAPQPALDDEKLLNLYLLPDYLPATLVPDFERETGIKVNVQNFENYETLNAKLVAGHSGFDLVVPGNLFARSQIQAGLLQPLNRELLTHWNNLDPAILAKMSEMDPGNRHLMTWAWGYTGVGINRTRVEKALGGKPLPDNAWELLFNPSYTRLLRSCGIAFLDAPTEVIPAVLHHLGRNPFQASAEDIKAATDALAKVRGDIRQFSSTLIDDLASGKVCAALVWGGDVNMAAARAAETGRKDRLEALIPSSGALMFVDSLAIPADAKHVRNAHAFMNFYLRPQYAAAMTNEMSYVAGNQAALQLVDAAVRDDGSVFPAPAVLQRMVPPLSLSNEQRAAMAAAYTRFKKGR